MTSSLLLQLKGPLQSWGHSSRFNDRATSPQPTKSGIVGLLAAADGRRRTDPIEDLARLTFAVRVDQPGSLLRDYQTAEAWQTAGKTNLVSRYYLSDAVFLAAVESEDRALLESLAQSLRSPRFPLYLGRRSCPANPDLVLRTASEGDRGSGSTVTSSRSRAGLPDSGADVHDGSAVDLLRSAPWCASRAHRRTRSQEVVLPIFRDGRPGEPGDPQQDVPLSFDQEHRRYGWRTVVRDELGARISNPDGIVRSDPFFEEVVSS